MNDLSTGSYVTEYCAEDAEMEKRYRTSTAAPTAMNVVNEKLVKFADDHLKGGKSLNQGCALGVYTNQVGQNLADDFFLRWEGSGTGEKWVAI